MDKNALIGTLVGIISFVGGLICRSIFDWIARKNQSNLDFSRSIKSEMVGDFLTVFPKLIQECKVQAQQFQYAQHEEYWLTTGITKESYEKTSQEVTDRSSRIIELKERCTMDALVFKNKDELQHLFDQIMNMMDEQVPKYFESHIRLDTSRHIIKINRLRAKVFDRISEEL